MAIPGHRIHGLLVAAAVEVVAGITVASTRMSARTVAATRAHFAQDRR
jgi:hypothetical protein